MVLMLGRKMPDRLGMVHKQRARRSQLVEFLVKMEHSVALAHALELQCGGVVARE